MTTGALVLLPSSASTGSVVEPDPEPEGLALASVVVGAAGSASALRNGPVTS
jgi:hypothetical protein